MQIGQMQIVTDLALTSQLRSHSQAEWLTQHVLTVARVVRETRQPDVNLTLKP